MAGRSDARPDLELWPGEVVLWSQGPDPQGALAARMNYASHKAHEAMLDCLALSSIAGVILSPIVAALAWVRHLWQGKITYTITTRRLVTLHGSELNWLGIDHFEVPRLLWRKGQVGSVLFPHDTERKLDLRFDGVRDPDHVIELFLQTVGFPGTRDPQGLN